MPCQNLLLSERLLLDISHEKGLMFNAKLTYLKIFHATLDFDLAEGYDRAVKSQCKQNIAIQHTVGSQCKYDSYYWALYVCYDGTGYPQSPGENIYIESSSSLFLPKFILLPACFYTLLNKLHLSSMLVRLAQENIHILH